MKLRILNLKAELLQGFGLLLALILLLGAQKFYSDNPTLAASLVFVFSLPYLFVAILSRRSHFLYGAMLFGAVAYFMACGALGARNFWFPLLAVPLVWVLWLAGQTLSRKTKSEFSSFSSAIYRAMNITIAVFSVWAIVQFTAMLKASEQGYIQVALENGETASIAVPYAVRYIAGLSLLCFAVLYMVHCMAIISMLYVYVLGIFAVLAGTALGVSLFSLSAVWAFLLAASLAVFELGTALHARRSLHWSRHAFFCAALVLGTAILASMFSVASVLWALAVAGVILWWTYLRLSSAIGNVAKATSDERLVGKLLFMGAQIACLPLAILILVGPTSSAIAAPAALAGFLFFWIALRRSDDRSIERNVYAVAGGLLLSGGVVGMVGAASTVGAVIAAVAIMALFGVVHQAAGSKEFKRGIAEATVFPALFAWYVPMLTDAPLMARVGALAALITCGILSFVLRSGFFRVAAGAAIAGIVISLSSPSYAWIICAVGAVVGGILYVSARNKGNSVLAGIAYILLLTFSTASIVFAATLSGNILFALTAVSVIAALITGTTRRRGVSSFEDTLITFAGLCTMVALVVLAIMGANAPAVAGASLLVLAVAQGVAYMMGRGIWQGRWALILLAIGGSVVMLLCPDAAGRLLGSALIGLILFGVSAATKRNRAEFCDSAVGVAYALGLYAAVAALYALWNVVPTFSATYGPLAFAVFSLAIPGVSKRLGARIFGFVWLSFAAMLAVAARAGTLYSEQMLLVSVIAGLWVLAGFAMRKKSFSSAMFGAATAMALFCVLISMEAEVDAASWRVFLISALAFLGLYVALRVDVFAYLVTLSLALMAYDWVRLDASHFTTSLFFYLVALTALLGVFFLLPYFKRWANRLVALPVFNIFTWRGAAVLVLPFLVLAGLLGSTFSVKATSHPKFCASCHNMKEYYTSWEHSSHNDVACIDCHFEPTLEGKLKGKAMGLVQVIEYASGSYGTRPHGIVEDASCMRSGCHENIEQSDKILLLDDKVRFRHDVHLLPDPRGKDLKCVSCHGEMVQGNHMSVTKTTCFTCHFTGRGNKPTAIGECQSCHVMLDEEVTFGNEVFNHRNFLSGNEKVECTHCHSQVTQGSGNVSPVRCTSCHTSSIDEVGDLRVFHDLHVSKNHFDCLQCHDKIEHGVSPMTHQQLTASDCSSCHSGERHTVQERVYTGTALPGDDSPDFMYAAGVACDGCHTEAEMLNDATMTLVGNKASGKQCADCHNDEYYGEMVDEWQTEIKERIADLEGVLADIKPALKDVPDAEDAYDAATAKLGLLHSDGSYGAHNYFYISDILDRAESDCDDAQSQVDEWRKATAKEQM